jgi:hypothetical protein
MLIPVPLLPYFMQLNSFPGVPDQLFFFPFSWALLMGSWISVSHCDLVWHWTLCNPFHLIHIQGARNEIFAMQPAPIQVSYMGFPGTTGAEYIDYLVTDEVCPWNAWLLITIVYHQQVHLCGCIWFTRDNELHFLEELGMLWLVKASTYF